MLGTSRRKVGYHRIQDGKAIVDITLYDGKLSEGGRVTQWVGDGYELLRELTEAIELLERKERRKRGGER